MMRFFLLAIVLNAMFCNLTFAGYKEGLAAYNNEDFIMGPIYLEPLAKKGDRRAQYLLGNIYATEELSWALMFGFRMEKEAIAWYKKAAEQGDALSQNALGRLYFNNGEYESAKLWYRKAYVQQSKDWRDRSNRCDAAALRMLGDSYFDGSPGADNKQAITFYRQAAKLGDEAAGRSLVRIYEDGLGTKRDRDEQNKYRDEADVWHKAERDLKFYAVHRQAEKGIAKFQRMMGLLYWKRKMLQHSKKWLISASENGDGLASFLLGFFVKEKVFPQEQPLEIVSWYRAGAIQGYMPAQLSLAQMYLEGNAVPQDFFISYVLYRLAVPVASEWEVPRENIFFIKARFRESRQSAVSQLSAKQLVQAEDFVANWKPGMPLPKEEKPINLNKDRLIGSSAEGSNVCASSEACESSSVPLLSKQDIGKNYRISRFYIDYINRDYAGLTFQEAGTAYSVNLPKKWRPDMKAVVRWEVNDWSQVSPTDIEQGNYRGIKSVGIFSAIVPVEKYDKPASVMVNFFPGNKVRIQVRGSAQFSDALEEVDKTTAGIKVDSLFTKAEEEKINENNQIQK